MIIKIKKKKILFIIFILLHLAQISNAIEKIEIIKKVNNEIITNIDIINEYNYLVALNNNLKNLSKKEANKISEESLIREIIKYAEITKFVSLEELSNEKLINKIIENIYNNLNLPNLEGFENYLKKFKISIDDVRKKISIEVAWNQLIVEKFNNQININENQLKERIKKNNLTSKEVVEYNLSEIVFQAKNQTNLEKKINEIEVAINNEGFKTAANRFSISDTAKLGGLIGSIKESQLSAKFRDELKKINKGEFSKPINVGNRFIILFINEKNKINQKFDEKQILKSMIDFERKSQFENYSQIYFDKIKLNIKIR